MGWYRGNSDGETHPVGQKKANGFGLYDMSGNVCEWVWDGYLAYPQVGGWTIDPVVKPEEKHICRGGSWADDKIKLRAAARTELNPNSSSNRLGVRLVRTAPLE